VFSPRRAFLRLEALEDRYCLSAPQVTLTGVQELANNQVQVTGHVTDDVAPTITLNFSGVTCGSTLLISNSDYSFTAMATGLGTISAQGTDTLNQTSNTAQINFTSAVPTVTQLSYTWGPNRTVTITGKVNDEQPSGRTVTLGGAVNGMATADANGNFSVTLTATALAQVSATVTDQWNQTSAAAATTLTYNAPVIQNFIGTHGAGNTWTFTGHVADAVASGIAISFGGLAAGQSVVTDANGNFTLTITLASGASGDVIAEAHNMWNMASADATFTVPA
jgi:hypothetical protein